MEPGVIDLTQTTPKSKKPVLIDLTFKRRSSPQPRKRALPRKRNVSPPRRSPSPKPRKRSASPVRQSPKPLERGASPPRQSPRASNTSARSRRCERVLSQGLSTQLNGFLDHYEWPNVDFTDIERDFLSTSKAATLYEDWGYRTKDGYNHERYEDELHTDALTALYGPITTHSDPLFRVLQQAFYEQRATPLYEMVNLFNRQIDLSSQFQGYRDTEQLREQVSRFLRKFLKPQRLQRMKALAEWELDEESSWNMAAVVVAARQFLLLADGCFKLAYRIGQRFLDATTSLEELLSENESSEEIF